MLQDVIHISSRLSPLSESGKSVASLETLVKDKPTPRRPMGQAMAGLLRKASAGPSTKKTQNGVRDTAETVNEEVDDDEDGVGMLSEPTPSEHLNGADVSSAMNAGMSVIDSGRMNPMASDMRSNAGEETADESERGKMMDGTGEGVSTGTRLDTAAPEVPNKNAVLDRPTSPPSAALNINIESSTLPIESSPLEPPVPPDKLVNNNGSENDTNPSLAEKDDLSHLHE